MSCWSGPSRGGFRSGGGFAGFKVCGRLARICVAASRRRPHIVRRPGGKGLLPALQTFPAANRADGIGKGLDAIFVGEDGGLVRGENDPRAVMVSFASKEHDLLAQGTPPLAEFRGEAPG